MRRSRGEAGRSVTSRLLESEPPPSLAPRYSVHRMVGAGATGEVFEATDTAHQRRVAIKTISRRRDSEEWTARFQREIQAIARLNHPNIVPLFDSGIADGRAYFVMPFIEGPTLRTLLEAEGPLPINRALEITKQIGAALSHAHSQGVIHRDVKPGNIMFSGGNAVLTDFGFAAGQLFDESITESDVGLGTPRYASPEQMTGSLNPGPASDVYALGSVSFEMLTGEPPFSGRTLETILAQKVSGEIPRIRTLRPAVPKRLDQVVRKSLSPVRADRFPDIASFVAACSVAMTTTPSKKALALSAVLAASIIASVSVLWVRGPPATRTLSIRMDQLGDSSAQSERIRALVTRTRRQLSLLHELRVLEEPADPLRFGLDSARPDIELRLRVVSSDGVVRLAARERRDSESWHFDYRLPADHVEDLQLPPTIAQDIATKLRLHVTPQELNQVRLIPTDNAEAWRLYQLAQRLYGRSDRAANNLEGARLFEAAAKVDPSFGEAWAKAGEALAAAYETPADSSLLTEANRFVERALSINPKLPEAYLAAGMIQYVQGRHQQAQLLLATALEARPSYHHARFLHAAVLRRQGKWKEALEEFEELVAASPNDKSSAIALGRTLMWLRRYDDAVATFNRAIALSPNTEDVPYLDKAWVFAMRGAPLDSITNVLNEAKLVAGEPAVIEWLVEQHAVRGWFWWLGDEWNRPLIAQRSSLKPSNLGRWFLAVASVHRRAGNAEASRQFADSAQITFESQLKIRGADPVLKGQMAVACALAGERRSAVDWALSASAQRPVVSDAFEGPESLFLLAQTLALVGDVVAARSYVDSLTQLPSPYSKELLNRHPLEAASKGR
ncbi:MAG: protein kinase domain-containing protein [Gemmatimonadaceae bacterium]